MTMTRFGVLALGVATVIGCGSAMAAAPGSNAPIATYWMDVATQSGIGAGSRGMDPAQMMAMMSGGGGLSHMLNLRLASKTRAPAAPQADHLVPAGLMMGPSLPLVTPAGATPEPAPTGMPRNWQQPKGRMLIYWGCGEHVAAGEPTVIDFSKMQPGKMPPAMAAMASMARVVSGPHSAPGFGQWPNQRDARQVPVQGSLVGAHRVQANYAPTIGFSLGAGQDFMPALGLREAGALPSGASRLTWNPAPTATGYALMMFGSNSSGDVVMWSSGNRAQMPPMDYLSPAEVRRLIASGAVLAPTITQCILPAEVASASPEGMVQAIGYGPEANFSDNPRAPIWATKVRFKTMASLMRGMGDMEGMNDGDDPRARQPHTQPQRQPRKRRGIGLGEILNAIPH